MSVFKCWSCRATFILQKATVLQVWNYLIEPPTRGPRINVYMAVPTIYAKLVQHYDKMFSSSAPFSRSKEFIRAACTQKIRYRPLFAMAFISC